MMYGRSFEDVQHLYSAKFRKMMSDALQLSIRRQREVIAEDLLIFAHSRVFSLTISEKEIEFLVINEMFNLVVRMIKFNSLLAQDSKHMNVDELF